MNTFKVCNLLSSNFTKMSHGHLNATVFVYLYVCVCPCVWREDGVGDGWSSNWITNELKVYNN